MSIILPQCKRLSISRSSGFALKIRAVTPRTWFEPQSHGLKVRFEPSPAASPDTRRTIRGRARCGHCLTQRKRQTQKAAISRAFLIRKRIEQSPRLP